MDLLLSHGYFLDDDPRERRIMRPYPPLGLLHLSSYLKREGFDVEIADSTFSSRPAFEQRLEQARPPVVGLYANLMTRVQVLRSIQAARRIGARVVVGGPEPANYADEYLQHGADVIVCGEGESTMAELLPRLLEGDTLASQDLGSVDGIVYREHDQGESIRTPPRKLIADLDSLPLADRDSIDLDRYVGTWRRHHGRGAVSMITARGCPFTCRWCSHGVFGFSHRRRSPESTADELAGIHARYRPDIVWYADDVFTIHKGWLGKYAEELGKRGLRVPFETISREDRLDEATIKILAQMGCYKLWVGSESGSQSILDKMDRRTNAERVREMVALLQRYGIEAGVFIMLGYDGEQLEDLEATVDHLRRSVPDEVLTTVSYPIKGTPYYEEVADRIVAPLAWNASSDRDLWVTGRASQRFYRYATHWIHGEVARERERRRARKRPLHLARASVRATWGRWGARLSWGTTSEGAQ